MPRNYRIKPGDCTISIADKFGFRWQTIWNHADNAALRKQRGDGFVLAPGDTLVVPDLTVKSESGATGATHRFQRLGIPAKLRLILYDDGAPLAERPCDVTIDGVLYEQQTDVDGFIELWIPPKANEGSIDVELEAGETITFILDLGGIDPFDTMKGVQQRLQNLGFFEAGITGERDDATEAALRHFCAHRNLRSEDLTDVELFDAIKQANGV